MQTILDMRLIYVVDELPELYQLILFCFKEHKS